MIVACRHENAKQVTRILTSSNVKHMRCRGYWAWKLRAFNIPPEAKPKIVHLLVTDPDAEVGCDWLGRPTARRDVGQDREGLLDWAETLLCNAMPMAHCTQADWDDKVRRWRDEKHGVSTPNAPAHLPPASGGKVPPDVGGSV